MTKKVSDTFSLRSVPFLGFGLCFWLARNCPLLDTKRHVSPISDPGFKQLLAFTSFFLGCLLQEPRLQSRESWGSQHTDPPYCVYRWESAPTCQLQQRGSLEAGPACTLRWTVQMMPWERRNSCTCWTHPAYRSVGKPNDSRFKPLSL